MTTQPQRSMTQQYTRDAIVAAQEISQQRSDRLCRDIKEMLLKIEVAKLVNTLLLKQDKARAALLAGQADALDKDIFVTLEDSDSFPILVAAHNTRTTPGWEGYVIRLLRPYVDQKVIPLPRIKYVLRENRSYRRDVAIAVI